MIEVKKLVLPAPGPIALRAADEALANVGVHEDGHTNSGTYVDQYLASVGLDPGNPWCAAFVYFRLHNAAHDLGLSLPENFPRSGYVPDFGRYGKQNGRWFSVGDVRAGKARPKKGDLACFYFASKERLAHIGFVLSWDENGLVTCEGNTSSGTGVDRDGGGVHRKTHGLPALGAFGGFIRLGF